MTLVVQNIILMTHRIQHFSSNWLLSFWPNGLLRFWPAPQEYQLVFGRVIQTWTKISHVIFISSLELFWFFCSVAIVQVCTYWTLSIRLYVHTQHRNTHTHTRSSVRARSHTFIHLDTPKKKHTKTLGKRVLRLSFFLFSLFFSLTYECVLTLNGNLWHKGLSRYEYKIIIKKISTVKLYRKLRVPVRDHPWQGLCPTVRDDLGQET